MMMAAARALAQLSPARVDKNAPLLPPIADSRKVSLVVAEAVGKQAIADGVAEVVDAAALNETSAPTSGSPSTCRTNAFLDSVPAMWASLYPP